MAAAERPVRFPGYVAKYSRQVGVGRLYYLRVWHWCTAAGCCAHFGCPHLRKYGGNLQNDAGETRWWSQCSETAPWSLWELSHFIYKLKVKEYFELPSVMCWRKAARWCCHRDTGRLSGKWDAVAGICLWCVLPWVYINLPHHGPFTAWFDS